VDGDRVDWLFGPGMSGALTGDMIRELLAGRPPLATGLPAPEQQVQPNGLDLTLAEVHRHTGPGRLAVANAERLLPGIEPIPFGSDGFLDLPAGAYHIVYNETVHLPLDVMALGRPRSTVARCGATIQTAVWDAGYRGRSTSLLIVANPAGFQVQRNARVMQLVFFTLARPADRGYAGAYQGENVGEGRTLTAGG
jgi:dUTP pyrophosphatase